MLFRSCGIAGEFEHEARLTALHARVGAPRTVGVFVAVTPAVIGRVGIEDHAGGAVFLSNMAAAEQAE